MQEALRLSDSSNLDDERDPSPDTVETESPRIEAEAEVAAATDAEFEPDAATTAEEDEQATLALEASNSNDVTEASAPADPIAESLDAEVAEIEEARPETPVVEVPSVWDSLKTPLLAVAAAVSLLVAGLNYATLEQTRAQLVTATEAKASLERTLADAEGRLAAAEKAVADVAAVLTATPALAAKKADAETR